MNKQQQGFTLIEVLIAMAIFLVGSAGLWGLIATSINTHREAIDEQKIAFLAESIVAELRGVDIVVGRDVKNIVNAKSKNYPDYTYDVQFTNMENNTVLVQLQIHCIRYGKKQSYDFKTVVCRQLRK
ncbi:MAG TPA: prepilin-type N-terminal cleavage/methylation domain-containing protein [Planctomycetota bacterium]|nr:prepilin-type N-terminal cleavage/methylation domain-containing protein [Planctomycetota bacterium]HPY75829.1 prepilin-type N-terminal cleavage/methylation domain-containing protein [Planctomycetota bacterium]HQB01393.1 prepilin-type N-terminal cleavage/methylation domain-containing protein [Planctomycetota bacterium]